MCFKKLTLLPR